VGALLWLSGIVTELALYQALVAAPTERFMGHVQRIFYFHVASAWTAYLAFAVVLAGSVAYLWRRDLRWDRLAAASAELGVLLTTATLASGAIWARRVWGAWWTWEPRLTTTAVLWRLYAAYLVLRRSLDEPERRARYAAVFGILAFLDVPVVHMSVVWWRSIHPSTIGPAGIDLHPAMLQALLVAVAAMTLLYAVLLRLRLALARLEEAVEAGAAEEPGGSG
jgi:heme exporter protein C